MNTGHSSGEYNKQSKRCIIRKKIYKGRSIDMKTTRKMLYIRKSVMIGLFCIFSLFSLTGVCHAAQADSEYTRLTYQGITKVINEKKGIRVT